MKQPGISSKSKILNTIEEIAQEEGYFKRSTNAKAANLNLNISLSSFYRPSTVSNKCGRNMDQGNISPVSRMTLKHNTLVSTPGHASFPDR